MADDVLFKEHLRLIKTLLVHNPSLRLADAPSGKHVRKFEIPQEKYPHIGFAGDIIGPGGATLQMMCSKSGARMMLQGRGVYQDSPGEHGWPQCSYVGNWLCAKCHLGNSWTRVECKNACDSKQPEYAPPLHVRIDGDTEQAVEYALAMVESRVRLLIVSKCAIMWCEKCGELGHRAATCAQEMPEEVHKSGTLHPASKPAVSLTYPQRKTQPEVAILKFKSEICRFNAVGKCTMGEMCTFAHDIAELRLSSSRACSRNEDLWASGLIAASPCGSVVPATPSCVGTSV